MGEVEKELDKLLKSAKEEHQDSLKINRPTISRTTLQIHELHYRDGQNTRGRQYCTPARNAKPHQRINQP